MLCFYGNIHVHGGNLTLERESSLIVNMISILVLSGLFWFVLNNGTIRPLFVCTEANYESGLRAAATYHANEGVSVK